MTAYRFTEGERTIDVEISWDEDEDVELTADECTTVLHWWAEPAGRTFVHLEDGGYFVLTKVENCEPESSTWYQEMTDHHWPLSGFPFTDVTILRVEPEPPAEPEVPPLDWPRLLAARIQQASAEVAAAEQALKYAKDMLQSAKNCHANGQFNTPSISPTGWEAGRQQWQVWIPPFDSSHFDGDNVLAPYGHTYWDTSEEAFKFLARVLFEIQNGKPEEPNVGPETLRFADGQWAFGFSENASSDHWWVDLALMDDEGYHLAELSMTDVEWLALGTALEEIIRQGRKDYSS